MDASDAWLTRLGYTREHVVGKQPEELTTAETAQRFATEYLPQIRRTGALDNAPANCVAADGEVVNFLVNSVAQHDATGRIECSISVFTRTKRWRALSATIAIYTE